MVVNVFDDIGNNIINYSGDNLITVSYCKID
jgi:hypothetical protein